GDAAASQGWTALIVDTNGNGRRDERNNEPGGPLDRDKDTRIPFALYGISFSPSDGSIWGSSLPHPGYIIRLGPGSNPPDTALAEIYKVPMPGYGIRGMDVDRNGVVWVPLDSGHIASFDRRKCSGPLNGPGAERGEKCPEGWTFYPLPGPGFAGDSGAAESPYYLWVDQHEHPRARRQYADCHRQPVGFAARTGWRPHRRTARSLSDGFLCQEYRWPDRRSGRRLEGKGAVGDVRQPHTRSHRRHRRTGSRRSGQHRRHTVEPAGGPVSASA